MTNRATVIPHGLSFLLQEAEEMEKYTRVPVARETDREDCVCVCECVCLFWYKRLPASVVDSILRLTKQNIYQHLVLGGS